MERTFPFGNFGLPFKKSRFPVKLFPRETINLPFAFHRKFPDFLGKLQTTSVLCYLLGVKQFQVTPTKQDLGTS